MNNIYDLIILWWWASWLMCSIFAPKNFKKLIIERNSNFGTKILLSWWERCNFTNKFINVHKDYFWLSKEHLSNALSMFSNYDMINFVKDNWIEYVENDNWRILLKSWNSKELLDLLVSKSKINSNDFLFSTCIVDVNYKDWIYELIDDNNNQYFTSRLIIATWWRSFPSTWTDGFGFNIARKFGLDIVFPYKWLCSFITKTDFSQISWLSVLSKINFFHNDNLVFNDQWNVLFTHFWLSWPLIYNMSLAIWNYFRSLGFDNKSMFEQLRNHTKLEIEFIDSIVPKRLREFFKFKNNEFIAIIALDDWKSWNEAKVTGWWVQLSELDMNFQSKKFPGLYFVWEVLDVTWKTWGYNLQFAWSSWYVCAKSL